MLLLIRLMIFTFPGVFCELHSFQSTHVLQYQFKVFCNDSIFSLFEYKSLKYPSINPKLRSRTWDRYSIHSVCKTERDKRKPLSLFPTCRNEVIIGKTFNKRPLCIMDRIGLTSTFAQKMRILIIWLMHGHFLKRLMSHKGNGKPCKFADFKTFWKITIHSYRKHWNNCHQNKKPVQLKFILRIFIGRFLISDGKAFKNLNR